MISLLLSPFLVMFLLWLFARHEAELNYFIIFYVVGGVSVLAFVLGLVSPWLGLAVLLLGLPFAIARWCYVSLPKAALVTFLYLATQIGLQVGWQLATRGAG
jgi:hypothetical protein